MLHFGKEHLSQGKGVRLDVISLAREANCGFSLALGEAMLGALSLHKMLMALAEWSFGNWSRIVSSLGSLQGGSRGL